jgi:flagellar protein FlbT
MALKVELKPGERVVIGECVITNGDQRTRFLIEGNTPILREKDIMTTNRADTAAKKIYLAVQYMYTSRNPAAFHDDYFSLIRDLVQAAPSAWPLVENINNLILTGDLYKAMKQAAKLMAYEKDLIDNAKCVAGLRKSRDPDLKSA